MDFANWCQERVFKYISDIPKNTPMAPLREVYCQNPIAVMGVVDTLRPNALDCLAIGLVANKCKKLRLKR